MITPVSDHFIIPGTMAVDPWLCNMGSPMTRHESERLTCTLLGDSGKDGGAKLCQVLSVGLKFQGSDDPVAITYEILRRAGLKTPEDLRALLTIPGEPMVCVPSEQVIPTTPSSGLGADIPFLTAALILGLCTSTFYDPSRPVVWTRTSLTRKVRLFTLGGFYASA